jgi:hypothetical protein
MDKQELNKKSPVQRHVIDNDKTMKGRERRLTRDGN